jgi:hypothetical protein
VPPSTRYVSHCFFTSSDKNGQENLLPQTIKEVEAKQLFSAGEEIQRLLVVSQNLRQSLIEESDRNEKMLDEVASAAGKVAQVLKISQNDQDTIAKLRQEIGKCQQSQVLSNQEFKVLEI